MRADTSLTIVVSIATPDGLADLAEVLAAVIEPGDVIMLQGQLGAGKTTLTQHLARSLGVSDDQYVSSPSFTLLHEYSGRLPVYHMDLYRLNDEEDVEAAGLLEYFDQYGVTFIEWPDRLTTMIPADRLEIFLQVRPDESRQVTLVPWGKAWQQKFSRISETLAVLKGR